MENFRGKPKFCDFAHFRDKTTNTAALLKVPQKNVIPCDVFWSCVLSCIKLYLYVVICRKIQGLSSSSWMMTLMMMMMMIMMTSLHMITHLPS